MVVLVIENRARKEEKDSTLGWSHWVVTPLSYYGSLKAFHVRFSTTITTSGVLVIRTVRKTCSGSQYTWYT